jgi:hypothetical protein
MKKKIIAGAGIIALMILGLVTAAFAFPGKGLTNNEAKEAVKQGDFARWKDAVNDGLTEEKFDHIMERQQRRDYIDATREQIRQAIENEDYDEWKEVIAGLEYAPMRAEKILTEEDFNKLVELHSAKKQRDFERAKELAEELGLERSGGLGKRNMHAGRGCAWKASSSE